MSENNKNKSPVYRSLIEQAKEKHKQRLKDDILLLCGMICGALLLFMMSVYSITPGGSIFSTFYIYPVMVVVAMSSMHIYWIYRDNKIFRDAAPKVYVGKADGDKLFRIKQLMAMHPQINSLVATCVEKDDFITDWMANEILDWVRNNGESVTISGDSVYNSIKKEVSP